MFYKQTVNNVEMVILCLDGGLLDLNRLRYNYFNRICKQYNYTISKEEFVQSLGNSKTMYNQIPIRDIVHPNELNGVIEKDLYEYVKLKQNIKKDGVDELLQFFRQKKIKVAVVSTHTTKRAVQYLQLAKIYKYVDFVIGGDSDCAPLPDASLLHRICTNMDVEIDKTVVIANFPSLVQAANELFMNIVYLQDFAPVDPKTNTSVYKVVKNNLEIINVFLFGKYDSAEIYSSVLGMSKDMDLVTLEKTYQKLLIEYQDDLQLIALVKRTYKYFLMEINHTLVYEKRGKSFDALSSANWQQQEANIESRLNELVNAGTRTTDPDLMPVELLQDTIKDAQIDMESQTIEEDSDDNIEGSTLISVEPELLDSIRQEVQPEVPEFVEQTQQPEVPEFVEQEVQPEVQEFIRQDVKPESLDSIEQEIESDLPDSFKQDATTINDLIDKINQVSQMEEEQPVDFETMEKTIRLDKPYVSTDVAEVEKENYGIIDGVLDFVYVVIISLLTSILSMMGYMLLEDYLQAKSVGSSAINTVIDFYIMVVTTIYTYIFDGIHAIIGILPNYETLIEGNSFFSTLAIQIVLFTIFNLVIYYMVKLVYTFIHKGSVASA